METVIGGILVAAASGLAWFAYNHPMKFRPVAQTLMITWAGVCLLGLAWSMGVIVTRTTAIKYLASDWEAFKADTDQMLPGAIAGPLIAGAVYAYLWFLHSYVTTLKDDAA